MSLLVYPSSPNWYSSHSSALSSPLPHLSHALLLAFASKQRLVLLRLPSPAFIDHFPLPDARGDRGRIEAVAWGRTPSTVHHLAVGSEDGAITVLDVRDRTVVAALRPSPLTSLTCIATSAAADDSGVLVAADQQGRVLRWAYGRTKAAAAGDERQTSWASDAGRPPSPAASSSAHVCVHSFFSLPVTCLALSPHRADECVVGSNVGELLLVNVLTGVVLQRMAGHEQQITAIEWRDPQQPGAAESGGRRSEGAAGGRGAHSARAC